MNRVVNGLKAPVGRALIARFGTVRLFDRTGGPHLRRVLRPWGSAGVLACEFRRRPVARRGTRRDAPQTRSRDGRATLAGDARPDWQFARWPMSIVPCYARLFPANLARFFAASSPELFSQVIDNQLVEFLAVRAMEVLNSPGNRK